MSIPHNKVLLGVLYHITRGKRKGMSRCDSFLLMFSLVFQLICPAVMDGGGESNGIIREGYIPLNPGNPFIHFGQGFGFVIDFTNHTGGE